MERILITNHKMANTSRNQFPDLLFKTKNSFTNQNQKLYCPYCEHCNSIKDENLDDFISFTRESKSILNKGFEYIINSGILRNKFENFNDLDYSNKKKNVDFYEESFNKNNKTYFNIEVNLI
jgi:hypothetical protein